jgi:hypothetical protein
MKKTAVTTLLIRMFGEEWPNNKNFNDMVDEVLELEKEQIKNAHIDGQSLVSCKDEYAEQYYNETYGKTNGS